MSGGAAAHNFGTGSSDRALPLQLLPAAAITEMMSRHAYAALLLVALLNSKTSSFTPERHHGKRAPWANSHRRLCLDASSIQRNSPSWTEGKKSELPRDQRDEIDALVARRADARADGDYRLADSIRSQIEACTEQTISPDYQIELKDIPRKDGGGSTWTIVPQLKESIERSERGDSVLQLSHIALGLAIVSAEKDVALDGQVLDDIVIRALARIERTGAAELRGRKAADAAFWFALSGVSSPNAVELFDSLTQIAIDELERFGNKPSCRAKDVLHIVERLYATGITGDPSKQLSNIAAKCLIGKDFRGQNTSTKTGVVELLQRNEFDLHCDKPLLWLWRFSIRQKKQRSFLRGATQSYERYIRGDKNQSDLGITSGDGERREEEKYNWSELFVDQTRPLVVDIGCGYGVSLHGLATLKEQDLALSSRDDLDIEWGKCNYLGIDLSRTAIGFANSLSSRWGISGRLAYVVGSAEDVLQALLAYPGNVCLATIQFPTPFKLQKASYKDTTSESNAEEAKAKGNAQLPKHPYADFMVTSNLLHITKEVLSASRGRLILQSNVEDVAVFMRHLAEESGFSVVPVSNAITSFDEVKARVPQRTKEYIKMGGNRKRALGEGWAGEALLPRRGATETEVACLLDTTPIHRCLLRVRNK